jgi:hypothetical protein
MRNNGGCSELYAAIRFDRRDSLLGLLPLVGDLLRVNVVENVVFRPPVFGPVKIDY